MQSLQAVLIDEEVMKSHIIPGHVLFTKPLKRRAESKPTLQYSTRKGSMSLRVMARMSQKTEDGVLMPIVESQTLVGNKQHKRGLVQAKVVVGNIPVQSGVVHLISNPLVIQTGTVLELMV